MNFAAVLHGFRRCKTEVIFALSWLCGLVLGIVAASFSGAESLQGIADALSAPASFPGAFLSAMLPFLGVGCCMFVNARWIHLLAGLRAFAFAYFGMAVHILFGSAGWLVRIHFQFGALCTLPLFCWFCIRCFSGTRDSVKAECLTVFILTAAIAAVDCYLIAPQLSRIAAF